MITYLRSPLRFFLAILFFGAFFLVSASIAVAVIGSGSSTTALSADETYVMLEIPTPGGAVLGDVLIASIAANGGSPVTITEPAGWRLIQRTDNDTNVSLATYWKAVSSPEPSSHTWTLTETRAVGGMTRYSGLSVNNPIDATSTATSRGTTAVASATTTSGAGRQVVALFAINAATSSAQTFTAPLGMTMKYGRKNLPLGPTLASFDVLQGSAGATGDKSIPVSTGAQRDWVAQLIALRPSLTEGLVSYWSLNGSSGSTTPDSHGQNPLTIKNGVTFDGDGAHLERDQEQYLTISDEDQTGLDLSNDLSIQLWVWFTNDPGREFFVLKRHGPTNQRSYSFVLHDFDTLAFDWQSDGSTGTFANETWNPEPEEWYHLVVTKDDATVKFYVDGMQKGVDHTGAFSTIYDGNAPLEIGHFTEEAHEGNSFDGIIHDVAIWERALSASEVADLYNSESGLPYPF